MPRPKGPGTDSRACLLYLATRTAIAAFVSCGLVALASAAHAETVNRSVTINAGCTTIEYLAEDVTRRFSGQETARLSGDQAAAFMIAYNQILPVSDFVATELLILFHQRFAVTRIAFFRNGCAVAMATVPITVVRALLRKTQGASI